MTSGTGRDTSATEQARSGGAGSGSPVSLRDKLDALPGIARFLWRSSRGYRLRPWASPYLRWRIETYWGWHADEIDAGRFLSFAWRQRRELWRFLLWAGAMASQQDHRLHS